MGLVMVSSGTGGVSSGTGGVSSESGGGLQWDW